MANESVVMINQQNFDQEVVQNDKMVLLDFWAPWCGPCRMLAPHIDAVAQSMRGQVVVGKVNVDENPALASKFGVMSIPTLVVLKEGRVMETMVGARGRVEIEKVLKQHLA